MEFRGTIMVRRPAPISNEEYSRVLAALNQRHEELGAVGGGGERDTAVFILSTDRYRYPAPAAAELVDAVVDALKYVDLEDAWPVSLDLDVGAHEITRAPHFEEVEVSPRSLPPQGSRTGS